jgi:hypothetical protein
MTADQLRTLGFSLRKRGQLSDEETDLVFSASNAIWRWVFFLEHRDLYEGLKTLENSAEYYNRVAELVLRWLRRPWGIVTVSDIDQAFRGLIPGAENDTVPRAFSALTPLLRSEIEEYLAKEFSVHSAECSRDIIRRFISCRYVLHICRHLTRRVRHDQRELDNSREQARMLVDLFTTWAYDGTRGDVLTRLETDLTEIITLLRSGSWLQEFMASETADKTLTFRQREMAYEYLKNPIAFSSRLFRFDEPEFRIEEWIGLMPPEQFSFRPRAEACTPT